ncbi:hypothetical protein VXO87_00530 [Acinetobacter baumannii]|uniref:hypothetical protein n=1 Tax=Acinetobacter baumannii TaxID=470 RepID=UPI003A84F93A
MAIGPIDYRLDVVDPFNQAMQGYQLGMQATATNAALQAQKAEEERRKQAYLQQQVRNEDLYKFSLIPNKTADDYSSIISRYPDLAEPYQKAWGILDAGQQQQTLNTASQVYAALRSQQPQIAKDILNEQIQAYDNSGKKSESNQLKMVLGLIDKSPEAAASSVGMLMSSVSPDKFKDILSTLGGEQRSNEKQPYELNQIAANTAKTVAETNDIPLAAEDRRTGVENQGKKIEYDNQNFYDKLSQDQQQFYDSLDKTERIEVARLRAAKAESPIQRVERLEKVENYANAAKQAADASNLAAKLTLQAKENSGAYWDRLVRQVPGTSENTFAKDIETLKSQVFLAQVEKMRGLGALTDKEGDAIRSSIASLDINQGPKAVQKNLSKIAQQMSAAAKSANRKAQLYATKGDGYSPAVMSAAKTLGISPAEAQKFVNENGL